MRNAVKVRLPKEFIHEFGLLKGKYYRRFGLASVHCINRPKANIHLLLFSCQILGLGDLLFPINPSETLEADFDHSRHYVFS